MPIALDTNVVVDLLRRRQEAVRQGYDRARRAHGPLCISVFVLQELIFGVEASSAAANERAKLLHLMREIEVVSFEPADAEIAGRAQAAMKRAGHKAPPADFIVGAHALARGCTLVTANTRHFQNIPGLELLNWRLSPEDQDSTHG